LILLDTNVVSELMKNPADPKVDHWFLRNEDRTALTSVTLGELSYGISRLPRGRRRNGLEAQLVEWRLRYADRTFPFGASAALRYGPMLAAIVASGRSMSLPDAQIAAIALDQGATLATRNVKDFAGCAIELVNPWD
jgi:predicted nucleic acid-binding protein